MRNEILLHLRNHEIQAQHCCLWWLFGRETTQWETPKKKIRINVPCMLQSACTGPAALFEKNPANNNKAEG
jgi:hypothetical protein